MVDRTADLHDGRALRAALAEDGYALLRGVLDADEVRAVACDVVDALDRIGWLADRDQLTPAVASCGQRDPRYFEAYRRVLALESLHRLANAKVLFDLTASVIEDEVFLHPGKVARIAFPQPDQVYGMDPHQDFSVLSSTPDLLTVWFPLIDVPRTKGGLCIMRGSQRLGFIKPLPGDNVFLREQVSDPQWVTTDYAVGDVVLFHAYTIHASLPNRSNGFRLSLDCRYQSVHEPARPSVFLPYLVGGDWASLTTGWSSTTWVEVPEGIEIIDRPGGPDVEASFDLLDIKPSKLIPVGEQPRGPAERPSGAFERTTASSGSGLRGE